MPKDGPPPPSQAIWARLDKQSIQPSIDGSKKAGYARFRDFLLYGERALAGKKALINIFQDTLALEYGEHPLAKYSVEWQPDDTHLRRVGNPRFYDHPYQSSQLEL